MAWVCAMRVVSRRCVDRIWGPDLGSWDGNKIHMVVLPRIRAFGGEKIFLLLQLMVIVIIVQEVVVSGLLLNSGAPFATVEFGTRLIFVLTIIEVLS